MSCENGGKALHVEVFEAMCGVLMSALSFHLQFKQDSEEIGFEFNPHDPWLTELQETKCMQLGSMLSVQGKVSQVVLGEHCNQWC